MKAEADVLILGSGLAGMSYALLMANTLPDKRVCIVSKSQLDDSNSQRAQGGMAVALDHVLDSVEQHYTDTLEVGDGCCDPEVVRMVVSRGKAALDRLVAWGTRFDRNPDGGFALAREGGHSAARVVHAKDQTGLEITSRLILAVRRQPNITILENHMAVDLLVHKGRCAGCTVLNRRSQEEYSISASVVMLATGGVGQIYASTTNPEVATGDGIAMAIRAGLPLADMEFVQFHPTMLRSSDGKSDVLVTEALRGFGAKLLNSAGEQFMLHYDPRGDLASRDIVSRAIHTEIEKQGNEDIYLDCRHLDPEELYHKFPHLIIHCGEQGLDPTRDLLPIRPAAHYLCGGIQVDRSGRATMEGLLVCGETSRTGLHGANRLASNSLLEAVVFAERAWEATRDALDFLPSVNWHPNERPHFTDLRWVAQQRKRVQEAMQKHVGIVRSQNGLLAAQRVIREIREKVDQHIQAFSSFTYLIELRNMVLVAEAIIEASLRRSENRGCFYKQ